MTTTPTLGADRSNRRRVAGALSATLVALALLAGCGGGGSEDAKTTTTDAKATTTTEAEETTTTEAEAEEVTSGLPMTEEQAPSGDWIMVRFLAGQEPKPENFQPGSGEARVYSITPDCSGDEGCALEIAGGGADGSFTLPDVEPLTGDPIELLPEGDTWTQEFAYEEAVGCTTELDGPYLDTVESRELEPVWVDGEIVGIVGTTLYTDTLTDEGKAAGCPATSEGSYGYATVIAPNSGIADLTEYEVDGTFRQTLEVTVSKGYSDPIYQEGGVNVTLPDHDVTLSGSCADGACSVDLEQVNGEDKLRQTTLESEDGLGLSGKFEETGGCSDDTTKEKVIEDGAYDAMGTYQDLIPVWVEDGKAIAFVGKFTFSAEPTELGMGNPSCSYQQLQVGWAYLVDMSIFDGA